MRLLLLNQYYPPDTAPTGRMLHDVARVLVERGHRVTVVCSQRSYDGGARYPARQVIDGVQVRRLATSGFGRRTHLGKIADYLSYYLQTAVRPLLDLPRPDMVLALTTPPFVGLLGRMLARAWSCPHGHWIMDLYPDVMAAHGMASSPGLLYRSLQALTRQEFRHSALTLSLGRHMARHVGRYAGQGDFVPLWGPDGVAPWPESSPVPFRRERGWKDDDLVLMYSGNMGLGHRFGEFLAAADRLGATGPRWIFVGGGRRRAEVESFKASHPAARIELHPYAATERLGESLASADVHLASIDAAWQGLLVPSKIQGIFAAGRPVIFVGPRENEIADWIESSGAGWIVAENDVDGLLKAVQAARNAPERRARGTAARSFAQAHFDRARNAADIAGRIEIAATKGSSSRDR